MIIEYRNVNGAWEGHKQFLVDLILRSGAKRVCEIGGGANPALPIDFVRQHGIDYLIVDISGTELAKAPAGYRTQVVDISRPRTAPMANCDLVFSKMLAEHVADGRVFHENCLALLRPGGIAFHYFPTLYAPPFVLNRLLPERLSYAVLQVFQRGRKNSGTMGKFPAYYQWCRGPNGRQLSRLRSVGFEILQYIAFFGYDGYYQKIRWMLRIHQGLSEFVRRRRWIALSSFAYVVLRRPEHISGNSAKAEGTNLSDPGQPRPVDR